MKRQTREERQIERDTQNALLRAYGYHWKRTEELSVEQQRGIPFDEDWTLLSPLEMPVDKTVIFRWIGNSGVSNEDVLAFISDHNFCVLEKDERQVWRIQTPSGTIINLKQTLQELERMRIDTALAAAALHEQKRKEEFGQSSRSLKGALDLYKEAVNETSAWGYSPYPVAKRLPDGTIEVTTYHFESEWRTTNWQNETQVVDYLYSDSEGYWNPGEWEKPT